ncbi:hypothetical protein [Stenotrophomonas phage BUCTxx100]|nr:hypothetical protein [Stenotrophomonas phage BUCTxx100]
MTTPTNNDIPSNSVQDRLFNAEKFDEFMNSDNTNYLDRKGNSRWTLSGIRSAIQNWMTVFSSSDGASGIGLSQSGSVQDGIKYVTPQMFGAKGNFNSTDLTGDDDTAAFQAAIDKAISLGYQHVYVPAGNYLITGELNLCGTGKSGFAGVKLVGYNWDRTILWFMAASQTSICISMRGGSGGATGRSVCDLQVRAHPATVGLGIALQLRGACFAVVNGFIATNCYTGLHLYNAGSAGTFTEFNRFTNCRLNGNVNNIFFERDGGDNSFHGNNFINVQNQVGKNCIGVKILGTSGVCYLYNQFWQMNFFGRGDGTATAFDITNCNTDYVSGTLTAEQVLNFNINDGGSTNFEFHGPFFGTHSIIFNVPTEDDSKLGRAVFSNRWSKSGTMSDASLTGLTVRPYQNDFADNSNNGTFPGIFRVSGTNRDSLIFANYNYGGNDFVFGTVAYGKSIQDFVYKFKFSWDGTRYTTVGGFLDVVTSTGTVRFSGTIIRPGADNICSLGDTSYRWTQVCSVNSALVTSDARRKSSPRRQTKEELDCFHEIARLPFVWTWLKELDPKDDGKLHSGPTVQSVIEVMSKYQLDWKEYSFIDYNEEQDIYSFRKEELLLWVVGSVALKQEELENRLVKLEGRID